MTYDQVGDDGKPVGAWDDGRPIGSAMMGLGIILKHIPEIPSAFTASFYSGLGPMLLLSSLRFMVNLKSHS